MTDTPTPPTQPQAPTISVLRQFIKDLSFENPGAQTQEPPKIEMGIDVGARGFEGRENTFEVVLKINAKATAADTPLFLVEMEYAGLFQLNGMSPRRVGPRPFESRFTRSPDDPLAERPQATT